MKFVYPGFKKKACTFSFDDGVLQDIRLIKMFDKYGLKGTFNLNSGFLGEKKTLFRDNKVVPFDKVKAEDVKEIYKNHEVAMHAVTHPHLGRIPVKEMYWQITEDNRRLSELTGYDVNGLAYPYGTYDDNVVAALENLGVLYARTIEDTYEFSLPENYLIWHPTCLAIDDRIHDCGERFLKTDIDRAILYIWGHAFEFDQKDKWEEMEGFCKSISGKDEVWYCTNSELAFYNQQVSKCHIGDSEITNPTETEIFVSNGSENITVAPRESIKF